MATPSSPRRTSRKLVFASICVTLVLLGLEVLARALEARYRGPRSEDPYSIAYATASGEQYDRLQRGKLVLQHQPFVIYGNQPGFRSQAVNINAQGFRGRDWRVPKDPEVARVIVLGGSTAFGYLASSDDAVFTAVMERQLASSAEQPRRRVEVLNAGVIAYDSVQESVLLATRLLDDFQPDLVIAFDGWNDFYTAGQYPPGTAAIIQPRFHELDRRIADSGHPLLGLLHCSALVRRMEKMADLERRSRSVKFADNLAAGLEQYRRSLLRMLRLARAFGAEFMLAPQPDLFLRNEPVAPAEQKLRAEFHESGYEAFSRSHYPQYVAVARAIAASEHAPFVDCTRAFDGSSDAAFVDSCHLTDRGNQMVGTHLAQAVAAWLAGR